MKEIFIKLFIVFGISLCVVLCVDALYRRAYGLAYKRPQNLLAHPNIEEKYKVVKLGNSHTQSGITFEKFKTKSLNLSSVAQRFETDLALLKQYQNQIDEGALIIINVSPISFSHTNFNSKKGFQSGYYGGVSPFYIPNLNWGDYIESELLPFVRSGHFWRRKYATAVIDRLSAQEKAEFEKNTEQAAQTEQTVPTPIAVSSEVPALAAVASDVPSVDPVLNVLPSEIPFNVEFIEAALAKPTKIHKKFEESVNFTYNKWYHTDEFDTQYFAINRRDLERVITFAQKHNWRPVLITIPITNELEAGLGDGYKQKYLYDNREKTNLFGTEYIDFSNDIRISGNNAWFANADHFNDTGAAAFSYVLLQTLIEKGYLEKDVDGYDYRPLYKESNKKKLTE
jgi:hypothetical protein